MDVDVLMDMATAWLLSVLELLPEQHRWFLAGIIGVFVLERLACSVLIRVMRKLIRRHGDRPRRRGTRKALRLAVPLVGFALFLFLGGIVSLWSGEASGLVDVFGAICLVRTVAFVADFLLSSERSTLRLYPVSDASALCLYQGILLGALIAVGPYLLMPFLHLLSSLPVAADRLYPLLIWLLIGGWFWRFGGGLQASLFDDADKSVHEGSAVGIFGMVMSAVMATGVVVLDHYGADHPMHWVFDGLAHSLVLYGVLCVLGLVVPYRIFAFSAPGHMDFPAWFRSVRWGLMAIMMLGLSVLIGSGLAALFRFSEAELSQLADAVGWLDQIRGIAEPVGVLALGAAGLAVMFTPQPERRDGAWP